MPKRNELVVCRIKRINPHSALAYILGYDRMGLIHVSEVASRWVRNIREFLKENQYVVCRVMEANEHHISLSVKRVRREEANRKLNEFKRERRAEKLLEMTGKSLGKNLKQTYSEVGNLLKEEFGSLTKAFETAFKNEDLLRAKKIPDKWIKALVEIAKKNYSEKTFLVKGNLKLISYKPDGIEIIKKVLRKVKANGLSVRYVSAPNYIISGEGKNYKEIEAKVRQVGEEIAKEFEKQGEASFELEK
jgi:translation initiation factor 2 subunit 1